MTHAHSFPARRITVFRVDALLPVPELMATVEATPSGSDKRLAALTRLAAQPPCAAHDPATEVWAENSDLHQQRRNWDQAIAVAWKQTMQLGYRSAPHPRRPDRRAARARRTPRRRRRPLHPAPRPLPTRRVASEQRRLTYLAVADWATALWWIDTALELTMNDGDRTQLIEQLAEMRTRALSAVGRDDNDDLGRRVAVSEPW